MHDLRGTEGEITSLVKEADVLLYAVGIHHYFANAEEQAGPFLLRDVTEITGGRTYKI
jgi:hypothetical protein